MNLNFKGKATSSINIHRINWTVYFLIKQIRLVSQRLDVAAYLELVIPCQVPITAKYRWSAGTIQWNRRS